MVHGSFLGLWRCFAVAWGAWKWVVLLPSSPSDVSMLVSGQGKASSFDANRNYYLATARQLAGNRSSSTRLNVADYRTCVELASHLSAKPVGLIFGTCSSSRSVGLAGEITSVYSHCFDIDSLSYCNCVASVRMGGRVGTTTTLY